MKIIIKLGIVVTLMLGLATGLYSNGMNLNGNGSKAIAMGGAFVGLADDYSAVYWNPAGLTQMKQTTVALFGTDVIPFQKYKFALAGIDAKTKTKHYASPGIGFFKPLSEKIVVGIYAYVPSGSGAAWTGSDLRNLTGGSTFEWQSKVGMFTVSPTIAIKLTDKLSIGATVNINYGLLKMKRPIFIGQYEEDLNGWAVGSTLGILYKPSEKFSLGVTYRTPVKVTLAGDVNIPGAALLGLAITNEGERSATFPMWLAGGIAFKPTAELTFTADVQYTNWKTMTAIDMDFVDSSWQARFASAARFELQWKDTVQYRFGMEYKVSPSFAVRGGYYYDPNPSPKSTQNILLPEITYNFLTFGIGYKSRVITLDFAVEYGIGKDKNVALTDVLPTAGMPGLHQMKILVPNIALTINL